MDEEIDFGKLVKGLQKITSLHVLRRGSPSSRKLGYQIQVVDVHYRSSSAPWYTGML